MMVTLLTILIATRLSSAASQRADPHVHGQQHQ